MAKNDVSSNFLKESAIVCQDSNGTETDKEQKSHQDSAAHFSKKELLGLFRMQYHSSGCNTNALLEKSGSKHLDEWSDQKGKVRDCVMETVTEECSDKITFIQESS